MWSSQYGRNITQYLLNFILCLLSIVDIYKAWRMIAQSHIVAGSVRLYCANISSGTNLKIDVKKKTATAADTQPL